MLIRFGSKNDINYWLLMDNNFDILCNFAETIMKKSKKEHIILYKDNEGVLKVCKIRDTKNVHFRDQLIDVMSLYKEEYTCYVHDNFYRLKAKPYISIITSVISHFIMLMPEIL